MLIGSDELEVRVAGRDPASSPAIRAVDQPAAVSTEIATTGPDLPGEFFGRAAHPRSWPKASLSAPTNASCC
ncbi:MAG: hypothetical protein WKG07_36090 [Hymenobacter sp.]